MIKFLFALNAYAVLIKLAGAEVTGVYIVCRFDTVWLKYSNSLVIKEATVPNVYGVGTPGKTSYFILVYIWFNPYNTAFFVLYPLYGKIKLDRL